MHKKLLVTGFCLLSACFPITASAQNFSEFYIFGDSLVDNGNVFRATNGAYPPSPPYFQGRFSNGPVFVELLAPQLGLTANPNTNFAFGGATSGTVNAANIFLQLPGSPLPGLQTQVNNFTRANPNADPNGLYVVYAGGNDYIFSRFLGTPNPATTVSNISNAVANLTTAGARTILVPNLPDLGQTPFARLNQASVPLTNLTNAHNSNLTTSLQSFVQNNPEVNVIPLDVNAVFKEIIADPARFGFTNVTDSCFSITRPQTPCTNPNQYLFSDEVHPSAATHRLLADYTFAVLTGPNAVTPLGDIALNVARLQTRDINDRLLALRAGQPRTTTRPGVFVSGDLNFGEQDATANQSKFDFNSRRITAGVDYPLNRNLAVGAALSYVNNDSDLNNDQGEIDVDGFSGSLYSNFSQENFYADAIVSYGRNGFDINRKIPFDNRTATASTDGDQFATSLRGGYNFTSGKFAVGPTAAIRYSRVNIDGYTEENAGSLNMVVHDQSAESLNFSLGAQASYAVTTDFGTVTPFVRASFEHEAANDSRQIVTELATQPGIPIKTTTPDPDRNFVRLGVGAQAQFSDNVAGQIGYETIIGQERVSDNLLNATVRYEF
ncbi:MAG: autotransporter domain-containing protein [Aphanothece sp. CMT-3BRIN-NPC111]|jgi:outer membrane lipase/esterase|nr:autotransporter domain-containing protein [Aphanothece sp. CMT-3BRIN-NPC111]